MKTENSNYNTRQRYYTGCTNFKSCYIVFENYEIILQWNRSLRFALAVCTLKDKFKNEI